MKLGQDIVRYYRTNRNLRLGKMQTCSDALKLVALKHYSQSLSSLQSFNILVKADGCIQY